MFGQTLSHDKILGELSRGGMGIVYRARDVKLNREVALEHLHIAVIYEIDEAKGSTFIVMELIQGKKLSDLLGRKSLPITRLLELATEVAEGLASAHDEGIVHRDLKPANVTLTEQGHAQIIDFGVLELVRPLAGEETDVATAVRNETDPGPVMGTVSHMSPEQARAPKSTVAPTSSPSGCVSTRRPVPGLAPPFRR